jgi:hypothetical protein
MENPTLFIIQCYRLAFEAGQPFDFVDYNPANVIHGGFTQ